MAVTATFSIELRTSAGPPEVWTTIPDVLAGPGVRFNYGLPAVGMADRVAETGRLTFTVLNSEGNSEGKVGYYTPGHVNCWSAGGALQARAVEETGLHRVRNVMRKYV